MNRINKMLIEYFTKFTDYIANEKYPLIDVALADQFMDPLKWDFLEPHKSKLKDSASLLTKCLQSSDFWNGLKRSHQLLNIKY